MSDLQLWLLEGSISFFFLSILALDMTMVQFLSIMRIRTMRDEGVISPQKTPFLYWYCMLVLVRGVFFDVWVNIFVCTIIGLELPKEWLTTSRLIRWNHLPEKGWWTIHVRKPFVQFGKILLDPSDTTGQHIK